MNIFTTDSCPIVSAQSLCDIHVNKMILESAQLLSTAHFVLDGEHKGYKATHKNHPCAIWSRKNSGNYEWLWNHFKALSDEFTFRTGKVHKSSSLLETLKSPPKNIANDVVSIDFMCMPDEHKKTLNVHSNYQRYISVKYKEWLSRDKPIVAKYTKRNKPEWLNNEKS